MRQKVRFILYLCFVGGLAACSLPLQPASNATQSVASFQYQTISAILTATVEASNVSATTTNTRQAVKTPAASQAQSNLVTQTASSSADPVFTPTPRILQVNSTSLPSQADPSQNQRMAAPCDLAQSGRILDVTVPDETLFHSGEYFSKTWRLVNAGSCTWTQEYAVIWFSGDDLGVTHSQPFEDRVEPGQTVDITVDMIAPETPGIYQSNWKLRSPQGGLFGIGPSGGAPFWARVVVIPTETPTVEAPTLSATSTPAVISQGTFAIVVEQAVDLDQGQLYQDERADLLLKIQPDGKPELAPVNGATIGRFGITYPGPAECALTPLDSAPLTIEQAVPGTYFCHRTNDGFLGRFLISAYDPVSQTLTLDTVTWNAP